MSSHYALEPPPTAKLILHTSSGPIALELFAQQAPLACRNFLQHCQDGYYDSTIFHRIVTGFLIQGGDPTGTGEGGESIYEDNKSEEGVEFKDEIHSRLRFNRRGLVGMAKSEDSSGHGSYGSQFFITLAGAEQELNGKCTLFGRVISGGDSIFNVMKIAEGELVEGSERPRYATKIERAEILVNPFEGMAAKERRALQTPKEAEKKKPGKKKKQTGKILLSFDDDEEGGEVDLPVHKKAKYNTSLVSGGNEVERKKVNGSKEERRAQSPPNAKPPPLLRPRTAIDSRSPKEMSPKQPRQADPEVQLPLKDPEIASRSPSPSPDPTISNVSSLLSRTNAQIAELKASMKRNVPSAPVDTEKEKSALEQMIPKTSIRGRKRPHGTELASSGDAESIKLLNAFKARLENADTSMSSHRPQTDDAISSAALTVSPADDDEEAKLCDLHFIADCQSCRSWDDGGMGSAPATNIEDDNDRDWMSHSLSFEKDRLGKDLTWKRKNEEELVVIDPREKGKGIREASKMERRRR